MKSPAFISYAREDTGFVLRLAGDLKARGANIWLDQLDIRPGQPWDREVERALTDCDEMLVILSPASIASKNVMDEVSFALDESKAVIPVLHGDCKVPFRLRRLHYVDFKPDYEQGLERLLYALAPGRQASATSAAQGKGQLKFSFRRKKVWVLAGLAVLAAITVAVVYPFLRGFISGMNAGLSEARERQINELLKTSPGTGGDTQAVNGPPGMPPIRVNPKDGLIYVWRPPGEFMMGCSPGDNGCGDDEKPPHEVTITEGFWIGTSEVTQEAYQRVVGKDPSNFRGAKLPVEMVSWIDAEAYCHKAGGRLPTEAEWEYAARAGNQPSRYGDIASVAWYAGNSDNRTHEVAQKAPNAWRLYDMLGNVREWTADHYAGYISGAVVNPRGPDTGDYRVVRGGSWHSDPGDVTASSRLDMEPEYRSELIGFRCAAD